ncbi:MAG TPA: hypothetical protein VGM50_13655 [Gemmatimonadaceae bacterium]|jgi:hypothetical protein
MAQRTLEQLPSPLIFHRDAILERPHVAAAIGMNEMIVEAMNLP